MSATLLALIFMLGILKNREMTGQKLHILPLSKKCYRKLHPKPLYSVKVLLVRYMDRIWLEDHSKQMRVS